MTTWLSTGYILSSSTPPPQATTAESIHYFGIVSTILVIELLQ